MNISKTLLLPLLAFLVISCSSVEVIKKDNDLYQLKSWGSKNKTYEQLKAKVTAKAIELCSPKTFEYLGSGVFDKKISGLSNSIGGFATYDPDNITHTFTQHIKCVQSPQIQS